MAGCSHNKGITNKQYIHGDFDGDGTPNIDDKMPFNKKKSSRVNPEISLSETFRYLELKRKMAEKVAKPIARKEKLKYRIKGTYSIINKAVRKNPEVASDLIGFRQETKNKAEALKKWKKFNKKYKVKKENQDNKYKTNKGTNNPYRALHSNLTLGGFGTEAQFRSKKLSKVYDEMHSDYKNRKDTKKYFAKIKKLLAKGY